MKKLITAMAILSTAVLGCTSFDPASSPKISAPLLGATTGADAGIIEHRNVRPSTKVVTNAFQNAEVAITTAISNAVTDASNEQLSKIYQDDDAMSTNGVATGLEAPYLTMQAKNSTINIITKEMIDEIADYNDENEFPSNKVVLLRPTLVPREKYDFDILFDFETLDAPITIVNETGVKFVGAEDGIFTITNGPALFHFKHLTTNMIHVTRTTLSTVSDGNMVEGWMGLKGYSREEAEKLQ